MISYVDFFVRMCILRFAEEIETICDKGEYCNFINKKDLKEFIYRP